MGPLIPQVEEFKARFGVVVGSGLRDDRDRGAARHRRLRTWPTPRAAAGSGRATPATRCASSTSTTRSVPVGTVGELVVRSDEPWVITPGYFNQPERTAEAWRNGWFHTGDGFRCDEDGNYYFVDRMKDAIRRRGENISSFEVEASVNQHPAVQECAAVAVPSELGEDEIKVLVVAVAGSADRPGGAASSFLEPRMPKFMLPRYVEVVPALPKTDATFRTRKVELRAAGLNDATWDREARAVRWRRHADVQVRVRDRAGRGGRRRGGHAHPQPARRHERLRPHDGPRVPRGDVGARGRRRRAGHRGHRGGAGLLRRASTWPAAPTCSAPTPTPRTTPRRGSTPTASPTAPRSGRCARR